MNNRILRLKEVIQKTGLSRSSIYQFMKDGEFPKSIELGARAVGWLESEIDLWVKRRVFLRNTQDNTND